MTSPTTHPGPARYGSPGVLREAAGRLAVASGPATTPSELVSLLGENPYWTVPGIAKRLGVAYTTAQRAIQRLVNAAALIPLTDAKRNRVYCARAILDILEEPAQLVPGG